MSLTPDAPGGSTASAAPRTDAAVPDSATQNLTFRQVAKVIVGLLLALFTAMLSTTIVANALPEIVGDLHGSQSQYGWVITAALLANAASTPIWGKLADLLNKKTLVQLAIIIFTLGSVACGFAPGMPWLIGARVLQGLGMGGLMALAQAIIATITPPRDRGRYTGLIGAVIAVAQTSGPLVGGLIVDSALGWRWTFFVCVPFAIASLILLQFTLRVPSVRTGRVHIDWAGSLLLTSGVSVLLIWISFVGPKGSFDWVSPTSFAMVGGGALLLIATLFVESKVAEPIIPLGLLRDRATALVLIASIPIGVALFSASTYLGEYFQIALQQTPTAAGLLQLPMVIGMITASIGTGVLISRTGHWKVFLIVGSLLVTTALTMLAFTTHETPMWQTGCRIAVLGLGMGMLMQNLVLVVQNTVSVRDVGAASSMVAFIRTFAGATGVAVLGTVLSNRVSDLVSSGFAALGPDAQASGATSGTPSGLDLSQLPDFARDIVTGAYGDATGRIFLISACLSVLTVVAVLFIPNRPLRKTLDLQEPETA
ncbi:MDR family MFS transporter [Pseudoclavibacter sp. 13-3]|uniref:MDR family MFS transporter n=1 Tax=Pseudoclavibacter sp. 13-3 TaxID=2901228 RepID=UPI001E4218F9|nr:MDR family MFS transporter [Pseudoclavibacter sp. 13-3]MCD7101657.1 MFS transporter [Pseudoclavibacter sp. 13-3]